MSVTAQNGPDARRVASTWREWTRLLGSLIAIAVLVAAFARGAWAHSLDEVDTMLQGDEKYFQQIDKPAPDFTLRAADGRIVRPVDLRGKVVVLHFIYTSCPDVCPLHAEKIAEIQKMVNATPMKDRVTFVTITTDPTRDTPDVLRDYGPAHGLDPVNWLFLTTIQGQPEDTTRKLAKAFGHKFTLTDDGYQMHGIVTHVIDKEGRWRANFYGLNFAPVNLVTLVNALTNNIERPHDEPDEGWLAKLKGLF
ncbi:putative oxidoreductase protein [Mesorhizobium metallidurans STM 2683]|uniref:Putative oxidoreductase protein n=1 Tax=Mesorhizobium metallidurans STM 2683 TaxID=1297569 RepID=M5EWR7_9HYPH|nr:SCO family protein [Mesorhizobium metallidurans]CCV08363.1 putative oxidoreductase protein [Mesorhizobium metallidurans STM 2683]